MSEIKTDLGALLLKACQTLHEQLPPGIGFAAVAVGPDGKFATACSPGIEHKHAAEMFATIDDGGGEVTVHQIHKRN